LNRSDLARELKRENPSLTLREIASQLGISHQAVHCALRRKKAGILPGPPKRRSREVLCKICRKPLGKTSSYKSKTKLCKPCFLSTIKVRKHISCPVCGKEFLSRIRWKGFGPRKIPETCSLSCRSIMIWRAKRAEIQGPNK